ncbi:MAG: LemA family protein [Minisyncoccia bacterium]
MNTLQIVLLIIGLFIIWLVFIYNSLVRSKNRCQEGLADIDVQLKRRYDLIPNLVETVKGYMQHEKSVFETVTAMRAQALNSQNLKDKAVAEDNLSGALKNLFAVAENYPQLKANENFAKLQDELTDTEDKIQAARRFYNNMVMNYNTMLQTFPNNIVVKIFHFVPMEFFGNLTSEEKEPVKVQF